MEHMAQGDRNVIEIRKNRSSAVGAESTQRMNAGSEAFDDAENRPKPRKKPSKPCIHRMRERPLSPTERTNDRNEQ